MDNYKTIIDFHFFVRAIMLVLVEEMGAVPHYLLTDVEHTHRELL